MARQSRRRFFPPASAAQADGLLMLGGCLTVDWLLEAYENGIFPWPVVEGPWEILAWFSPDPRAVIELDQFHISRRLRRRIRSERFAVTSDRDFSGVVAGCAGPRRGESGTWITAAMAGAFGELHRRGHAHSVEVWHDEQLVGGVYGVAVGGYFAGESMFYRERDASKVALAYLVAHLRRQGYELLDVQQSTPHIRRLGAVELGRQEFLRRLESARGRDVQFGVLQPEVLCVA